jgi:hypothetical protein
MVEGKVVLAVIARHFAFEKIGLTGKNGEEEVHNNMAVTSVPCDGMRIKGEEGSLKKICSLATGFWESSCLLSQSSKI